MHYVHHILASWRPNQIARPRMYVAKGASPKPPVVVIPYKENRE